MKYLNINNIFIDKSYLLCYTEFVIIFFIGDIMGRKNRRISLHKRFSLYNFASAIIPVILSILITVAMMIAIVRMVSVGTDRQSVVSDSRSVITSYTCQYNMRLIEKNVIKNPDTFTETTSFKLAHKRVEKYNIGVCVMSDADIYYITDGYSVNDFLTSCNMYESDKSDFVYYDDFSIVIRDTISTDNNSNIQIIFMNVSEDMEEINSLLFKFYKFSDATFFVLLIAFIAIATVADIAIVKSLTQSILKPIENLREAADKIKNGILDEPIEPDEKTEEFHDLCTDFDNMRLELKKSIEVRQEYERDRKNTYSGLSHDARTAITTIKGYSQGLIDGVANTPEKQARYINAIYNSTHTLEKLMDALSEVTDLEGDNVSFKFRECDMYSLLNEWYSESKHLLEERKIRLNFTYRCNQRVFCKIDTFQCERVIDNIFSNSLKYKKPDKEYVNISVIAKVNPDHMFELIISDDGMGIRPDESDKIFDRFYRSDEARSNVRNGSGIVLTLVKQIVARHNGNISAFGETDKGLTIVLQLPITAIKEID